MNSVLKRLKSFKKLTVKETIELIQNEVENQQEHMKLALIGKGQWRICQQFKSNLEISGEEYSKLTSEKRKRYLSFRNTKQIRRYYHLYCTFNGIQMLHKRRSSNLSFMVFFCKLQDNIVFSIAFKGYLRYITITFQNVPSEAQVKNFFISQKIYVPFSRY